MYDWKNEERIEEALKNEKIYREKLISELHDIALSLKAMSGRNVVKTGEDPENESYIKKYFARSDVRDKNKL